MDSEYCLVNFVFSITTAGCGGVDSWILRHEMMSERIPTGDVGNI